MIRLLSPSRVLPMLLSRQLQHAPAPWTHTGREREQSGLQQSHDTPAKLPDMTYPAFASHFLHEHKHLAYAGIG